VKATSDEQRRAQMTKRERAIQMREAALVIVRANGTFGDIAGGSFRPLQFDGDGIKILYRSPFQRIPPPSGEFLKQGHLVGIIPKENLQHGLDIWAGLKVLNIEWADKGTVHVAGYKAGAWEAQLESLAQKLGERR
jgi:hypothetical protein